MLDLEIIEVASDIPTEIVEVEAPEALPMRKLYFINEIVEWYCTIYAWTGCTNVEYRDQIMANASELIRQIIRKQGLHTIYPGQDESSFGDLLNVAWIQIEKTLYKYRANPHCRHCYNCDRPSESLLYKAPDNEYGIKTIEEIIDLHKNCPRCGNKLEAEPLVLPVQGRYGGTTSIIFRGQSKIFNMWSQIAKTVILAYIKKESRDRKNGEVYLSHLEHKTRSVDDLMLKFLSEAREICKFHNDYLKILDAMEWLIYNDDRSYDGAIVKLVERTGLSRIIVTQFMHFIRLRSLEFTYSPFSADNESARIDKRNQLELEDDG